MLCRYEATLASEKRQILDAKFVKMSRTVPAKL
jgi:hypothetical protein